MPQAPRDPRITRLGHLRQRDLGVFGLVLALVVAGCGDSGSSPADPDEVPTIEISGVEDGAVYTQPVTVTFTASPPGSTTSATLNGETFRSGDTVDRAGAYTLRVEAFRAGRSSEKEVSFSLEVTGERVFILRMFDLGEEGLGGGGDALLLSDSSSLGMRHAMVDAGPRGDPGQDLNHDYVVDQLQELGVETLDFLQLTHAHSDHFEGMRPILNRVEVERFIYNGQVRTGGFAGSNYQAVLQRAEQRADSVMALSQEWEYRLGGEGGTRTVHVPGLPTYLDRDTNDGRELNEGSLGTYVETGGVRIFLTGDGEDQANQRWRSQLAQYTADLDILKVGHHGANNAVFDDRVGSSTQSTWLEHTRPALMLITANGRSHPRIRALNRLFQVQQAEMYCTNVHGTVTVRVAEGWWEVTTERNGDMDCVPGDDATT